MSLAKALIADPCECAAPCGKASLSCPHEHVPHVCPDHARPKRRPSTRLVRLARLVLMAVPVGLLSSATSLAPAAPPPASPPPVVSAAQPRGADVKPNAKVKQKLESAKAVRAVADALSRCRSSLSESERWRIADAIERESREHGWDPLFVQALIEIESTCKPTARSARGALGLTQVKPSTARAVADEAGVQWRGASTLLDPETNLRLGLHYLRQLEEQLGDIHLAVAAYNLGPGRAKGMTREGARRSRYVRKIIARYEDLLADHATARS